MPKFIVEVRDRATIDVIATVTVEADTPEAAIAMIENAGPDDPLYDLDFEND